MRAQSLFGVLWIVLINVTTGCAHSVIRSIPCKSACPAGADRCAQGVIVDDAQTPLAAEINVIPNKGVPVMDGLIVDDLTPEEVTTMSEINPHARSVTSYSDKTTGAFVLLPGYQTNYLVQFRKPGYKAVAVLWNGGPSCYEVELHRAGL